MKRLIGTTLFSAMLCCAFAQNTTTAIEVRKGLGTTYLQNGKKLTAKQLMQVTQSNAAAYEKMKLAKSNYNVASVLGFIGGALVGWPVGTAIAGGEPEWALAGVGAGVIAVSLPLNAAYNKHAKEAVALYNTGLERTGLKKPEVNLGLAVNGISVKVMF